MRMMKPRRGEVWRVELGPTRGDEMRKTRPAVVVSDDQVGKLNLCIVVPVTDWKDRYAQAPWMIRLNPDAGNGLVNPSAADAFQVRSVSHERLQARMGSLPQATVDTLAEAIALCVGYRGH